MSHPDPDFVLKVIMIGDSGVGKSCLLKGFMGEGFDNGYTSTIGVDFEIKAVVIGDRHVNLQVWDTAGQERFHTITTTYYRSSDAILLVFDVTDKQSWKNCERWLEDVRRYAKDTVEIMLIANKLDIPNKRVIDYKTAKDWADKNDMEFMETSAKTNANVEKAFLKVAEKALIQKAAATTAQKKDGQGTTNSVQLTTTPHSSESTGCSC